MADDIKDGKDPTINIRKEYLPIESGHVPLEDLEIKLTLAKDPDEYPLYCLQRHVGTELSASQGDTIRYYKSDRTGGGTSHANLISRRKYLVILRTAVEDSLIVMGCDYLRDIVGFSSLDECNRQEVISFV